MLIIMRQPPADEKRLYQLRDYRLRLHIAFTFDADNHFFFVRLISAYIFKRQENQISGMVC